MPWHALYSKPRTEKKLAERLKAKGFEVYAPTQTIVKQWSDRKKKVEEVFFKSYVFVNFEGENDKLAVLQTPGAVAIVRWLGKPAVIRDEEIEAIKDFLARYQGHKIAVGDFKPGEKLRVVHGALEDQYGEVVRQTKHRVALQIEQLGMSLYVELPKSQVEKISE